MLGCLQGARREALYPLALVPNVCCGLEKGSVVHLLA